MTDSVAVPSTGEALAAGIVWAPVCTAVVALRFAARRYQRATLQADDWLTIPALVSATDFGKSDTDASRLARLEYVPP